MDKQTQTIIAKRREIIERLQRVLVESLNLDLETEEVQEDAALFGIGIGLDSIDALQFVVGVESEFDRVLPSENLLIYRSLNTVADYLLAREAEECK